METRHFLEGSLEGNLRPRKGAGVSLEDEIGETRLDLSHLSWATAFVCQLGRCQDAVQPIFYRATPRLPRKRPWRRRKPRDDATWAKDESCGGVKIAEDAVLGGTPDKSVPVRPRVRASTHWFLIGATRGPRGVLVDQGSPQSDSRGTGWV